jgi:hypothetical protein
MRRIPVNNLADVLARKDSLKRHFTEAHQTWRDLEAFRRMDVVATEDLVWKGVSQQNRKWTILKSDIASIDFTTESFLLGDGITVTAEPKDAANARLGDAANILERLGMSVWEWSNRDRAIPLEMSMVVSAVERGHLCLQYGWRSWEERGETRETVEPQQRFNIPGFDELDAPRQRITTEGGPPFFIQVLDPIDCYWQLGKDDRVLEFVHEFRAPYSQLLALYPELADHPKFKSFGTAATYDTALDVVDYWNEHVNAIVINGIEYKAPTEHQYGQCPFVVELIAPELRRYPNDDSVMYMGRPFSLPVLEHVKALSWADSISATYMEEIAFALLQHKGIQTQGARSPYIGVNPETKEAEFHADYDFSPDARVLPMYDGESLEYLQPPRLVDMLQEFKAARMRDIQLLTYAEGILTGVYNLDISGHSVSQQKQAAMQRLAPLRTGTARGASRLMTEVFGLFPLEWDRVGPFLVDMLVDGVTQTVPVTRETFAAIKKVVVDFRMKVPIAPEAEMQWMLNAMQMDVFSHRRVMEKSGVEDPNAEMMQIAFEKKSLQTPEGIDALAAERFKQLGYTPPAGPEAMAPAAAPAALPAAAPMPAPMPAPAPMPMTDPMMAGGGAGAPAPGGFPPEIMAIIQQLPPEIAEQLMALPPEQAMALLEQAMNEAGGMNAGPGGGMPVPVGAGPGGPMGPQAGPPPGMVM